MYCSQGGTENQPAALFCQKCGNALSSTTATSTTSVQPQVPESLIWNPNAAVNWSFIFSPAFGSYLQMLNWRTLGEPEKATSSRNWFYVSLGMSAVYALMGVFMSDSKAADNASPALPFLFFAVWTSLSGRAQVK